MSDYSEQKEWIVVAVGWEILNKAAELFSSDLKISCCITVTKQENILYFAAEQAESSTLLLYKLRYFNLSVFLS